MVISFALLSVLELANWRYEVTKIDEEDAYSQRQRLLRLTDRSH